MVLKTKSSKLSNLENFISCLVGWIFTSINVGSVSILITTIGNLFSAKTVWYASFMVLFTD